jgi:hypothetical protein
MIEGAYYASMANIGDDYPWYSIWKDAVIGPSLTIYEHTALELLE